MGNLHWPESLLSLLRTPANLRATSGFSKGFPGSEPHGRGVEVWIYSPEFIWEYIQFIHVTRKPPLFSKQLPIRPNFCLYVDVFTAVREQP